MIRSWIDFAAAHADVETLQKDFLGRNSSVGSCTKCHAVSAARGEGSAKKLSVEWKPRESGVHSFTHFSHGVHVNLLGGGSEACMKCHVMNPNADYAASFRGNDPAQFVSNFSGIKKEACMQCHGAESKTQAGSRIRQDCLLCHTYHLEPGIKNFTPLQKKA